MNDRAVHPDLLRAAAAADSALRAAMALATPGRVTHEIDEVVRAVLAQHGAVSMAEAGEFPAACAVSVNDVAAGGVPGAWRLAPGDVVTIDVACAVGGWWADVSRSVVVECAAASGAAAASCAAGARATARAARLVAASDAVLAAMLGACRAGVRWGQVVAAGKATASARGVSLLRAFGAHGLGGGGDRARDRGGAGLHAAPAWPGDTAAAGVLEHGMLLAIEPVVVEGRAELADVDPHRPHEHRTRDSGWAAGAESTVLVEEEGVWVFGGAAEGSFGALGV